MRITPAGLLAIEEVTAREHGLMSRVGGELTAPELDATLRVLHHMDRALIEIETARAAR